MAGDMKKDGQKHSPGPIISCWKSWACVCPSLGYLVKHGLKEPRTGKNEEGNRGSFTDCLTQPREI